MKQSRVWNILLIVGCALPVLMLFGILFRGQTDISEEENRTLARFPALSMRSFAEGTFQDGLESALSDQHPMSRVAKKASLTFRNDMTRIEGVVLRVLWPQPLLSYTEIIPGYYHFAGDEHYIVEKPWEEGRDAERIAERAKDFNALTGVNKYVYFIRNSRSQDFTADEAENDAVFNLIREAYRADGWGCFKAKDFEEYCQLFYETDHHWNCYGSDRGYREILTLLGVEDAPIEPQQTWEFETWFNGSYARQTKLLCADKKFTVLSYPLEKMKMTMNGKNGVYGHRTQYERGRFPSGELRNHYAYYYGGDYGEIVVDNDSGKGRNLLLVADSYSNPINMLLASHFDHTYIIDLRYYENDIGQPFDWDAYVSAHNVDTVLVMGDVALFTGARQEVEEEDEEVEF